MHYTHTPYSTYSQPKDANPEKTFSGRLLILLCCTYLQTVISSEELSSLFRGHCSGADLGSLVGGGIDIICNTYNLSATPFLQISLSAGQSWGGGGG